MSINISSFNPKVIPETNEKQLYRDNAIPTYVRFLQHCAETTVTDSEFQINLWIQFIRPDELFLNFCQYCDEQPEVKKWTSKAFQVSILKYLGLRADMRDCSNNGDKLLYNSAEEFIARLRVNKLYSRF